MVRLTNEVLYQLLQNQAAILLRVRSISVNQGKLLESMDRTAIEKCLEKTGELMQHLESKGNKHRPQSSGKEGK